MPSLFGLLFDIGFHNKSVNNRVAMITNTILVFVNSLRQIMRSEARRGGKRRGVYYIIYVYVCICICMYVYIYIYTYIYIYICTY